LLAVAGALPWKSIIQQQQRRRRHCERQKIAPIDSFDSSQLKTLQMSLTPRSIQTFKIMSCHLHDDDALM
jgi:hypothetical protein